MPPAHFNLVILGRLDSGINELTAAMARVCTIHGEVISGDYLDKKLSLDVRNYFISIISPPNLIVNTSIPLYIPIILPKR